MSKCPLFKDGKCEISDAVCHTGDFDKEKCTGIFEPEYVIDIKDNECKLNIKEK